MKRFKKQASDRCRGILTDVWNSSYARAKYPNLRIVAQIIYYVPAGAVACERFFSALKRLVNSRLTRLLPPNTNTKIFTATWLRIGVKNIQNQNHHSEVVLLKKKKKKEKKNT